MLPSSSSRLKDEFVRHVTEERESRAALKVHNSAALKIQVMPVIMMDMLRI